MKIVRNKYIPFAGYKAINLFGILFVKNNTKIDEVTINHERIHTAQMRELLYILFYIWYVMEWFIRLFLKGSAYRNISFEREAYTNQDDLSYLKNRKRFDFASYIKKTRA